MIEIKKIDFETILPIWEKYLWPARKSPIRSISSMKYLGGYDMSIYDQIPSFFAAIKDDKIVGVNSGFKTADAFYRSRGIFVLEEYRKLGVSQLLFEATEDQGKKESCSFFWSIPRKTAINSYLKYGFKITSEWFDENMEFGPNCYVCKSITDQQYRRLG